MSDFFDAVENLHASPPASTVGWNKRSVSGGGKLDKLSRTAYATVTHSAKSVCADAKTGGTMADSRIPLSDLIAELRQELATAKYKGQGQDLKLQVEEAEIELQVIISKEEGGGGGVKFWVLNADASEKFSNATTQKIKVKMKPLDATGNRFKINRTE